MLALVVSVVAAWGIWYVLVLRHVAASNRRGGKAWLQAAFEALGPQVVGFRGPELMSSEPLAAVEVSGALFRFGRWYLDYSDNATGLRSHSNSKLMRVRGACGELLAG